MNAKMFYVLVTILLLFGIVSCSSERDIDSGETDIDSGETETLPRIETFTFSSSGTEYTGKIYLPASYRAQDDLPAIYLIDFTDQHFIPVSDEFKRVIDGVHQIEGFEALVVSLENIPNIDAKSIKFQEYYEIYRDMTSYVDDKYTNNPSRTFIGRGSEAGVVLQALFLESSENSEFTNFIPTDPPISFILAVKDIIKNNDLSKNKLEKKLHFSFSTSNDRSTCTSLIDLINHAQYEWLDFESIEYTDSDYVHTYPTSYAAGLEFVFD